MEANKGYQIDKKTVRRIVEHLEKEGLVKTKEIKVTISYSVEQDSDVASSKSGADDQKFKIVPIVHAPGYEVSPDELQQYESIRNPMRIKEESFKPSLIKRPDHMIGTRRSLRQRHQARNFKDEGSADHVKQESVCSDLDERDIAMLDQMQSLHFGGLAIPTQQLANGASVGLLSRQQLREMRLKSVLAKFHIELKGRSEQETEVARRRFAWWAYASARRQAVVV